MNRPVANGIPIIAVGDGTTHGGKVISGVPHALYNGKEVARLGDMVDCPQSYPGGAPHGVNPIVEGEPMLIVDGIPVALEGHSTACGCKLIASSSAKLSNSNTTFFSSFVSQENKRYEGEIIKSKVLPNEIEYDVLDKGIDFGLHRDEKIPVLSGVKYAWFKLKVGGTIRFLIHTKEIVNGTVTDEGYVEHKVKIPKVIPYTHNLKVDITSLLRWWSIFSIKTIVLAIKLEPLFKKKALLDGLNLPLISSDKSKWMDEIPFNWSDEIPLSP